MRGTSVGVQRPSRPACSRVGCRAVVGADLHALAAADAAGEEIGLVERAGRTEQALVAALAEAGVGAHQGNMRSARGEAGDGAAAAKIGRGDFLFLAEETELEAAVRAGSRRSSCT